MRRVAHRSTGAAADVDGCVARLKRTQSYDEFCITRAPEHAEAGNEAAQSAEVRIVRVVVRSVDVVSRHGNDVDS